MASSTPTPPSPPPPTPHTHKKTIWVFALSLLRCWLGGCSSLAGSKIDHNSPKRGRGGNKGKEEGRSERVITPFFPSPFNALRTDRGYYHHHHHQNHHHYHMRQRRRRRRRARERAQIKAFFLPPFFPALPLLRPRASKTFL